MLPKLLYERLDNFGFDFVVLYPSMGACAFHSLWMRNCDG